jgi:hypothetical protein
MDRRQLCWTRRNSILVGIHTCDVEVEGVPQQHAVIARFLVIEFSYHYEQTHGGEYVKRAESWEESTHTQRQPQPQTQINLNPSIHISHCAADGLMYDVQYIF